MGQRGVVGVVSMSMWMLAACGGGGGGGNGPQIVDISLSAAELTPTQSLTVTVVVQPHDDMTPVTSAQLRRGTVNLGTFEMSAANTFTTTATWQQLAGTDLGGQMGEGVAAPMTVVVFDQAGEMAEEDVSVDLTCTNASEAVCNGTCLDVTDNFANCGGCGNDCTGDLDGTTSSMSCHNATCGVVTPMLGSTRGSCDQVCSQAHYQGQALTCANVCYAQANGGLSFQFGTGTGAGWTFYKNNPYTTSTLYDNTSCSDVPVTNFDDLYFDWERCCCVAAL